MTVATAKASWFDSWAMMPAVIGATIIAALATRLSQAIAEVAERVAPHDVGLTARPEAAPGDALDQATTPPSARPPCSAPAAGSTRRARPRRRPRSSALDTAASRPPAPPHDDLRQRGDGDEDADRLRCSPIRRRSAAAPPRPCRGRTRRGTPRCRARSRRAGRDAWRRGQSARRGQTADPLIDLERVAQDVVDEAELESEPGLLPGHRTGRRGSAPRRR